MPGQLTPEAILEALRKLHGDGADMSTRAFHKTYSSLYWAARVRFGSYRGAMDAAGLGGTLPPAGRRWTRDLVIEELSRLHAEGRDFATCTMRQTEGALLSRPPTISDLTGRRWTTRESTMASTAAIKTGPTRRSWPF